MEKGQDTIFTAFSAELEYLLLVITENKLNLNKKNWGPDKDSPFKDLQKFTLEFQESLIKQGKIIKQENKMDNLTTSFKKEDHL